MRTVVSSLPETMRPPSGLNAALVTKSVEPVWFGGVPDGGASKQPGRSAFGICSPHVLA